jgi:hypothetical protein
MGTIQKLRAKAQAQGNLKTSKEQKVVVQDNVIVIEPASPTVVYVPTYNPTVIYGPWWYPAYPPYPYYPAGAVVTAGVFSFTAGVIVGAAWNGGWGRWDWGHNDIDINVNRNVNINRNVIANYQTTSWRHDPVHRGGVPYPDAATRERYAPPGAGSPEGRRDFRGFSQDGSRGSQDFSRQGPPPGARPTAESTLQGLQQREGAQQPQGLQQRRGSMEHQGPQQRQSAVQRRNPEAFQGMENGRDAKMNADRGRMSREISSGRSEGFGGRMGSGGFEQRR